MIRSNDMAKVSLIIPTKDRRELLLEALDSIRAQTCAGWEAIVADDGSTDGSAEAVAQIAADEPRVRFVPLPAPRSGASAARNEGVKHASGDYVIFLDSDDALAPDCLRRRVEVMSANPNLDFAVFPCQVFAEKLGDTQLLWNADTGEDDLDRLLKADVPWQTTSPIWRTSALAKIGPWDEEAPSAQDWEFHIRALVAGLKYARFGPPDCYWRRGSAERESIGKAALQAPHLRARVEIMAKMHRLIEQQGLLTEPRRRMIAGMYFRAAERMAERASRREARSIWKRGRGEGLLSFHHYIEGVAYFFAYRWETARAATKGWLERNWPVELLAPRSPLLVKTPMNTMSGDTGTIPASEVRA